MKVAIVIGHSATAQGAVNKKYKMSEYQFNWELAKAIKQVLKPEIEVVIVTRKTTYKNLPDEINALKPDYVVSLHCNAFNQRTSGTETLFYNGSKTGHNMAMKLQRNIVEILQLNDRGVKGKTLKDRGGHLLRYTNAPCVIVEPFFIDNNGDFDTAKSKFKELAAAIASAIESFN